MKKRLTLFVTGILIFTNTSVYAASVEKGNPTEVYTHLTELFYQMATKLI